MILAQVLQTIKVEKGLSSQEKIWYGAACTSALIALALGYFLQSPMLLVAAFAFWVLVFAQDEGFFAANDEFG